MRNKLTEILTHTCPGCYHAAVHDGGPCAAAAEGAFAAADPRRFEAVQTTKGENSMKKLLATAIAIMMVFAISTGALALFGFTPGTTPIKVDSFKVDVSLYDVGTTGANSSMITGRYPTHAPTSGVRSGERYAFAVTLTMPAYNGLTATGQALVNAPSTALTVTTENLIGFTATTAASGYALLAVPGYGTAMSGDTWGALPANGSLSIPLADLNALEDGAHNTGIVPDTAGEAASEIKLTAECVINKLADAKVTAVFGAPDPDVYHFTGGATLSDPADATCLIGSWSIEYDNDNSVYYMREIGTVSGVRAFNGNEVTFRVGNPDNAGNRSILDTYVDPNSGSSGVAVHRVAQDPTTGSIIFLNVGTGAANTDADEISRLSGVLNRAFAAMGFTWTPGGVLYDSGFEALASRGMQFSDTDTFYAYTASLTVPGTSGSKVPDTGDMSALGMALIALALITGSAVIVKKVRA